MRAFFVTLNWNTTGFFKKMLESVDATARGSHTWVIVDNGSYDNERRDLVRYCADRFKGRFALYGEDRAGWGDPGNMVADCVLITLPFNIGCVLGHNLSLEMCAALAGDDAYDVVLMNTDIEVYHEGWLPEVQAYARKHNAGIVGMEHSAAELCAGAVFLDTQGYWYLHKAQLMAKKPVRGESVGMGLALLRWPVPTLRFDEGYRMYYKQDDDLCFQVRANLGLDIVAYPVDMIHWGNRAIRGNDYVLDDEVRDKESFEAMKRENQRYFAKKWAWALRGRRKGMAEEGRHLAEMDTLMRERRLDSGLSY